MHQARHIFGITVSASIFLFALFWVFISLYYIGDRNTGYREKAFLLFTLAGSAVIVGTIVWLLLY